MVEITQTGYIKPHETASTIEVSGPWTSGNEDYAEVHLAFYDGDTGMMTQGWFNVSHLLLAIAAVENESDA